MFKSHKSIDVHFEGFDQNWFLGKLALDSKNKMYFEYSKEAKSKSMEFSPRHCPIGSNGLHTNFPDFQYGLPGFIYDSLPDGWGMLLMDRWFAQKGVDSYQISILDRLAFLGSRAMGAYGFTPSDDPFSKSELSKTIELKTLFEDSQKIIEGSAQTVLNELIYCGGSPQGARPKALLTIDPKTSKASTCLENKKYYENAWLIKFPAQNDSQFSCEIEYIYSKLAQKAGLIVPETSLFELSSGIKAFGTKRFDRSKAGKVPMHSMAGFLHVNFRLPCLDYVSVLKAVRFLTKSQVQVDQAFRLSVFNAIYNNQDDHSKNFSFCMASNGTWEFSPAYDLTYCVGPGGEHQTAYCGYGKNITRAILIDLALKAGVSKQVCSDTIEQVLESTKELVSELKNLDVSSKTSKLISDTVLKNLKGF